jgi:ABC-2 type transport system ATP-binding protein
MLEAVGLTKKFGDYVALDNLHLTVAPGEVFCLLGANGAGKTTTINLFLGFVPPTEGTVRVDGLDVTRYPRESKQRLAYVPEQVMLYRQFTGFENLEYFSALGQKTPPERSYLRECLRRTGLPEEAFDRNIGTYSKGMRQKVGIALALARQAKALLLDEPTSGLDPQATNEFSLLVESLKDDGVAILMATHDLFRAREVGTRLGIMKQGRMVDRLLASEVTYSALERIYLEYMRGK